MLEVKDSAGYEWEEIKLPSSDNVNLVPPEPALKPQQLCGYLSKSSKGPIKSWKNRWFVFEDHQCCLFYYNSETDFTPQGYINISNALFSYSVESSTRFQFDIRADGHVHSLQASSREAMFYWLNQLQIRRRKFSKRQKNSYFREEMAEVTPSREALAVGSPGSGKSDEDEQGQNRAHDYVVPLELQQQRGRGLQQMNGSSLRGRFSFRKQITGLFRPSQTTQPPSSRIVGELQDSPGSKRRSNFFLESTARDSSHACSRPRDTDLEYLESSEYPSTLSTGSSTATDPPHIPLSRKLLNKVSRHPQVLAGSDCVQCQLTKSKMGELELELERNKQQLEDHDTLNEFLRNEIRMMEMKTEVKKEFASSCGVNVADDKKVDILLQRDQTIAEYQRLLEEAALEKERQAKEIENKTHEVEALREQVELFTEAVAAKDHIVVDLTNKLFEMESKAQVVTDPTEAMKPSTIHFLELEIQQMKETVDAYKRQNQFISNELLEMNKLRSDDLAVNKHLVDNCHELEAKFVQLESKYLVLLRESQEPQRGVDAGPSADLISQMMEEALGQSDTTLEDKEHSGSFDVYGFCHSQHDSLIGDDDLLGIKVRKNELHAHRVLDDMDAQHKLQWEMLWTQNVGTRHLLRSVQLKQLIRKGIPREYRPEIWKWIVKDSLKETYQPGMYADLIKKHVDQTSVAMNQIELDLYRTLPTHKHYKSEGEWINKLRRVLVAFSWYDTSIGYCQGLNRLAAIALLFLDEEQAFWCLVTIVHHHLPRDYYDRSLLGSQADQRVLRDILRDRAPALTHHLANCDIDFSLITFNWFHTIFVDTMPSDTMVRIWDTFLYEGSKVLFRYAVAIFLYNQDELLAEENSIAIFNRLRRMCKEATDAKRLTEIAFYEITRFSMDAIRRKRDYYHKQIKDEIEALDKLRAAVIKDDYHQESEEELCEPQASNTVTVDSDCL